MRSFSIAEDAERMVFSGGIRENFSSLTKGNIFFIRSIAIDGKDFSPDVPVA